MPSTSPCQINTFAYTDNQIYNFEHIFNTLFTVWNLLLHTSQTSNLQAWLFNNKISWNKIPIKWFMRDHCDY